MQDAFMGLIPSSNNSCSFKESDRISLAVAKSVVHKFRSVSSFWVPHPKQGQQASGFIEGNGSVT